MFWLVVHMILLFCMTFTLGSSLTQFIGFVSSQGLLGAYTEDHPLLGNKSYADWTEEEMQYVMDTMFTDLVLVVLFVLQHSLMARHCWRRCLHYFRFFVCGRLVYVIMSSWTLIAMINRWMSIPDVLLWEINTDSGLLRWLFFFLLHTAAWMVIFLQIRLMDPLELIGVKQVYYYHKGKPSPEDFMANGLRIFYQHQRHGGTACLCLMLWVHPVMTLDRFLLALLFSVYLFTAQRVTLIDHSFARTYFSNSVIMRMKHRIHSREQN